LAVEQVTNLENVRYKIADTGEVAAAVVELISE